MPLISEDCPETATKKDIIFNVKKKVNFRCYLSSSDVCQRNSSMLSSQTSRRNFRLRAFFFIRIFIYKNQTFHFLLLLLLVVLFFISLFLMLMFNIIFRFSSWLSHQIRHNSLDNWLLRLLWCFISRWPKVKRASCKIGFWLCCFFRSFSLLFSFGLCWFACVRYQLPPKLVRRWRRRQARLSISK